VTKTTGGWIIFIAAIGMLTGAVAADVVRLMNFNEMVTPAFIGGVMLHISSTIAAFVGGKLIPEDRNGKLTRSSDSNFR